MSLDQFHKELKDSKIYYFYTRRAIHGKCGRCSSVDISNEGLCKGCKEILQKELDIGRAS